MIFGPFYYDTGCAAYVFGCGGEGIGVVVDSQAGDVDAPVLSLDRNAFIDAVSVVPEKPADMAELMKINRGLA